jgi:pyroglutamyl-peptidase
MTRVVIAGFGPFPGAPTNPGASLVKALARRRRPGLAEVELVTHVFSTSYAAVDRDLPNLLMFKPDIVLLFGLARGRDQLCIETRARNAASLLLPDADRCRPQHGAIAIGKPRSHRGNAPFASLLGAARAKFPSRLSHDAGRYLCNYVYWRALQQTRGNRPLVQFVHIPPLRLAPRRRSKTYRPPLDRLLRAAEAILIELIAASRH